MVAEAAREPPDESHAHEAAQAEAAEIETRQTLEPAPDPFSPDWLERALAGSDEPRGVAPRFGAPGLRRPAAREPAPANESALDDLEAAPSPEPAAAAAQAQGEEPAKEAPKPSGLPAPVEIGRYRANDVAYIMFSDGSISAETPAGKSYKFNSLIELRAFIEKGGV
jgi:hypothetical protein